MNTDNQMLRRLVGLRLLLNRPLTADDPPISVDDGTGAPDAPYNPWTPEDEFKQLVARRLLAGRPLSIDDLPARESLEISPAAAAASPATDWGRYRNPVSATNARWCRGGSRSTVGGCRTISPRRV